MLIRTDRQNRERQTETEIRRGGRSQRQIRTKGQRVTAAERDELEMETQRDKLQKDPRGSSQVRGARRSGRENHRRAWAGGRQILIPLTCLCIVTCSLWFIPSFPMLLIFRYISTLLFLHSLVVF